MKFPECDTFCHRTDSNPPRIQWSGKNISAGDKIAINFQVPRGFPYVCLSSICRLLCCEFLGGAKNLSAKMAVLHFCQLFCEVSSRGGLWVAATNGVITYHLPPTNPNRSSGALKLGSTLETFIRLSLLQLAPCCLMSFSQLLPLCHRLGPRASGLYLLATTWVDPCDPHPHAHSHPDRQILTWPAQIFHLATEIKQNEWTFQIKIAICQAKSSGSHTNKQQKSQIAVDLCTCRLL